VSAGNFKNIRYCFKSFIYLIVLYSYSFSHAGSYDDYFIAIKRDEAAAVSALLKRGFDANTLNPAGEHGLLLAIREPSLKVAAVLIDWPQTNVEVRSKQDESPLMLASLQGLTEICQLLIAKGADVNKPGWAPLHYAATHGHLAVMTLLLDNDAYIDAASPNGTTPLILPIAPIVLMSLRSLPPLFEAFSLKGYGDVSLNRCQGQVVMSGGQLNRNVRFLLSRSFFGIWSYFLNGYLASAARQAVGFFRGAVGKPRTPMGLSTGLSCGQVTCPRRTRVSSSGNRHSCLWFCCQI
jgi:hypothetical protein